MVTEILKTSNEWLSIEGYNHFTIEDPTGWDLDNFAEDFFQKKITEAEFYDRVMKSTIRLNEVTDED